MGLLVPSTGLRLAGHVFLGRGPEATGRSNAWRLRGHAFRCARCGGVMPADQRGYFDCPCGAFHVDWDMLRIGSQLGDANILVYRPAAGPCASSGPPCGPSSIEGPRR
jgi:hypothetical protein